MTVLRTLLLSTLYPSSVQPGHGVFVETRLRELLRSGQVQSRVVAPVPWFPSTHPRFGHYARQAAVPRHEVLNGIVVDHPRYALVPKVGMNLAPLGLALSMLGAARRAQAQGFDFDLIDAHYFYPDGVAAALVARWLGKSLVITARGSDINLIGRYRLPAALMRWAARQAGACVGVSRALTEAMRDLGMPPDRLHVMRNGIDLERFRPLPPSEMRAALGIGGQPVILSVGNLVPLKGHDLAIEALALLRARWPGACLRIAGAGPERERLQQLAAARGLADAVQLVGAVPQADLLRWYSAADVLVLASSREGWPNVLLEAMACGTPAVATAVGGIPEAVCTPAAGRLAAERTPAALADALAQVLSTPWDRAATRAHAEDFGWQDTTAAQIAVFRKLSRTLQAPAAAGASAK